MPHTEPNPINDTSVPELQRRLLFTLLWPAAAVCRRFRVPLSVLEGLTRLAYFEELRRGEGATQAEVAEIFGTSLRTVVGIERRYRDGFLVPDHEVTLSRQVEEALQGTPRSAEALAAALEVDLADVRRVLAGLTAAGRVSAPPASDGAPADRQATFQLDTGYRSLVKADLLSRVDGLKHQLEVVLSAVQRRFLGTPEDQQSPSMARTLSFLGRDGDVAQLMERLVRGARLHAIEVEEAALQRGGHKRYGLTLALAATEDSNSE